jgi:dihydroflavonol-4-reductase
MRVLVTGSNGHVGNHVVRELGKRGHEVVAMVREGADCSGHEGLALTHALGDVLDEAAVRRAARGVDAIIHLAAVFALGASDVESIVRPAVVGTEHVLRAAKENRARVVHCSSTYAVGFSTRPEPLDETKWNERLVDAYAAAKTLSEKRAWALASELDVDLVAILPNGILGPLDFRKTPSHGAIIANAMAPAVRYAGGLSFTDVRDAAWMLTEALTKGTRGERYLVVGENLTIAQLVTHVAARTGNTTMPSPLPRALVVPTWRALETMSGWVGAKMPISAAAVDEFYGRWGWFDCAKAKRTFDWTPRPALETIDLALQWCAAQGWITGKPAARIAETLGPLPPG